MLLSIIIPSYNHERFVVSTIQAAARIDVQDKEIIVIDDGSSDTSVSVIREYIASKGTGNNIRLIARENRGLVKTLNEGLSIARGKYFYLVGSDDIPIPEGISSLVNHLENNSSQQFALGNALFMDSEYQREFKPIYGEAHRCFFALPYDRRQKEMFLHLPLPILLQATVFKTSALKDMGGWREDIISDDLSLWFRLFSQLKNVGKDFAYHPDVMACFYRQHDANIHKNVERQFMMIDQALTHLCPAKWQDAAYLRNFAQHSIIAVRIRDLSLAVRLFHSSVAHMGLLRWLHAAGPAIIGSLTTILSRHLRHQVEIVVAHEPAATLMDHPSDRRCDTAVLSNGQVCR
jgi:glycosyltransferase involved in cell wall biosynthesis